jgi:ketosteroid isomerase-like protein
VSEVSEFLAAVLPRQVAGEREVHNGRAEERLTMWSRKDPVSVFGVWRVNKGWDGVRDAITQVAKRFSACTAYDFKVEVADVSGDLAYTVGYEPTACSVDGVPQSYTLRVTNIYRREDGEWRLVHRHADRLAGQQPA